MKKSWYNILPWMALVSGILVIVLLGFLVIFPASHDIKDVINRKIAYEKLMQIRIEAKEDMKSKAFIENICKLLDHSVITTKWLIDKNGKIIYADGIMAASTPVNSNVYTSTGIQDQGLIKAVAGNMDSMQRTLLYVASAIRSEGEHNDVYGHLVMPLKTDSNELVGFIGVSYSFENSDLSTRSMIAGIALLIGFFIYWLFLPLWIYFDCRDRNNKYLLWTIFVLIGNLPAFIAYLIARRT